MKNVEEQILSYPQLSADKKREVEAYVEDHPEWASLLRDVRSLESLAIGDDGSDPLLTAYVVYQYVQDEDSPSELKEAFSKLEERLQQDPALQERAEAIRQRLADAEDTIDPVRHFEDVTGHGLSSSPPEPTGAAEPTSAFEPAQSTEEGRPLVRSFVDHVRSLPLAIQCAGAAIVLLLGTYVGLFAASEASQTTLERLAAVEEGGQVIANYSNTKTRSVTPAPDTATVEMLYVEALSTLRTARTSTFGLFPSYDAKKLRRVEQRLTEVLDRTDEGSFLALEARFYLGKVYLAQDRVAAAYNSFKTVVEGGGRKANEAEAILETLETEYPEAATTSKK